MSSNESGISSELVVNLDIHNQQLTGKERVVNCECRTTQKFLTAADAPEGGNPPPAASTETCSPPLPHERRTSRLPLLPSGPCGVRRAKGVSGALQLRLSHRRPRGTEAHGSSRLPPLDSGTAPRASAPAYRRFRVPGDAEPPSLVRRHLIVFYEDYIKVWYK